MWSHVVSHQTLLLTSTGWVTTSAGMLPVDFTDASRLAEMKLGVRSWSWSRSLGWFWWRCCSWSWSWSKTGLQSRSSVSSPEKPKRYPLIVNTWKCIHLSLVFFGPYLPCRDRWTFIAIYINIFFRFFFLESRWIRQIWDTKSVLLREGSRSWLGFQPGADCSWSRLRTRFAPWWSRESWRTSSAVGDTKVRSSIVSRSRSTCYEY